MTIFSDLTGYTYLPEFARPGTKNIGWLGKATGFELASHPDNVLELVWDACGISIAQTRGFHLCPFCEKFSANRAQRRSQSLLLGTSEIRIFSKADDIYAAPTLIYHYMAVHNYCPPKEFMTALIEGLRPSSDDYFSKLRALELSWTKISSPSSTQGRYRFVRLPDHTIAKIPIEDGPDEADVE
jgi:hypothetical protein